MDREFEHSIEINLVELCRVLLKKIWISFLCAVILAPCFALYSMNFITPIYTSKAQILVLDGQQGGFSSSDLDGLESLANDCMYLMESKDVLEAVIEKAGLDITPRELSDMIVISNTVDTRIITVTVRHTDPVVAANVVELLRAESKDYVAGIIKFDCMKLFGSASIPTTPSTPNIKKNTVCGAAIGFVIPLMINFVLYMLNDKLVTPDDVENRLGIGVIGKVPYSRKLGEKRV
jgi:capsular polysaccharide biosynthesis protein